METSTLKKFFVGAVLKDISKSFDAINYESLIGKLPTYYFDKNESKFSYGFGKTRNKE